MKLLSLFAAGLACVKACPPPFNSAKFIGVNYTAADLEDYANSIGLANSTSGWVDAVSDARSNVHKWPRLEPQTETHITYCWADPLAKQQLEPLLDAAIQFWYNGLGGRAGQASGHSLNIVEAAYTPNTNPFCSELDPTHFTWQWNHELLPDTLMIKAGTGNIAQATTGYVYSWQDGDKQARHQLHIPEALATPENEISIQPERVKVVAHEIGHVIGLHHEQQREDRDHYIRFQCDKLEKYAETKAAVEAKGEHTMDEVCKSPTLGYQYGFQAVQYATDTQWMDDDLGKPIYAKKGGIYDTRSIMHYPSNVFQAPGLSHTPEDSVVFAWEYGNPTFIPPPVGEPLRADEVQLIQSSDQGITPDLAAHVKEMYPWDDSPP